MEESISEQLYKSIKTFDRLAIATEYRDKIYRYNDALMQSIYSILDDAECDADRKKEYLSTTLKQYVSAMEELFPHLISKDEKPPIEKSDPTRYEVIEEVEKFNPYHDRLGRFSTANGATSFTYKPGQGKMYDNAIAREKERTKALEAAKPKVAFTPAKTKKEATQYATDQLGFKKVSYGTKLDIDTINHINEEITKIQTKYPETKGAVETLKTTTSKHAYAQIRTYPDGSMNFEVGSHLYGRGLNEMKSSYERDVKSGFHPQNTDYRSIIHHEYGHVLAIISSKDKVGVAANKGISDMDTKRKFIADRRKGNTESEWRANAAQSLGKSRGEVAMGISRYATKNPAETFAEAFAEVSCSPNPRADAVAVVKASGWYR